MWKPAQGAARESPDASKKIAVLPPIRNGTRFRNASFSDFILGSEPLGRCSSDIRPASARRPHGGDGQRAGRRQSQAQDASGGVRSAIVIVSSKGPQGGSRHDRWSCWPRVSVSQGGASAMGHARNSAAPASAASAGAKPARSAEFSSRPALSNRIGNQLRWWAFWRP